MRVIRPEDVKAKEVSADAEGNPATGVSVQVMVPEGPNFVLRVFTVKPGGHTPRHRHAFEHEVYVLAGKGRLEGDVEAEIGPGDTVFVPGHDLHCFVNAGDDEFRFICVVSASVG